MDTPKVLPVVEPPNQKAKPHHKHLPKVDVGVAGGKVQSYRTFF